MKKLVVFTALMMIASASAFGSMGDGTKTVAAAATPERLVATSTPFDLAVICNDSGNTTNIALGFTTNVNSTASSQRGAILTPGACLVDDRGGDLRSYYVDVATNGAKVPYMYKES